MHGSVQNAQHGKIPFAGFAYKASTNAEENGFFTAARQSMKLCSRWLTQQKPTSKQCSEQGLQSKAAQTLSQQQGHQPLSNCCFATVNSMPLGENA